MVVVKRSRILSGEKGFVGDAVPSRGTETGGAAAVLGNSAIAVAVSQATAVTGSGCRITKKCVFAKSKREDKRKG